MKKILISIIVLLMALLTACAPSDNKNTQSPVGQSPVGQNPAGQSPAAADSIKIGINLELSGEGASYGQSTGNGIEMAIEEINAAGGINGKTVELVKYDNKTDAAEATTLATKLVTQDKVIVILGPATSGAFKAEIPVGIDNKVPVISGSATADDVTVDASGVKEYAFRICYNDSYQGTVMANFALDNMSANHVVIIKDSSSDYGKGLAENFISAYTADGGTIVAEEAYVKGDTDFNAILTKIKDMSFDAIFIPGYYNEAGLIIKQARALGITVPILGADGFDSPSLLELAGAEALSDVYFSNHYSSLDEDPIVVDFIAAFNEKYGKDPDAFNALGFDLAKFACDAIGRASDLTGEAVKDALVATTDFSGITGSFSVDENHNPVKSIVVIEMQDGVAVSSMKAGR